MGYPLSADSDCQNLPGKPPSRASTNWGDMENNEQSKLNSFAKSGI